VHVESEVNGVWSLFRLQGTDGVTCLLLLVQRFGRLLLTEVEAEEEQSSHGFRGGPQQTRLDPDGRADLWVTHVVVRDEVPQTSVVAPARLAHQRTVAVAATAHSPSIVSITRRSCRLIVFRSFFSGDT
jgi:hypothetical protein